MRMTRSFGWIFAGAVAVSLLAGCAEVAIRSAPAKQPRASQSDLAQNATRAFWENFYEARYENIPQVQMLLTAAYLENPNDPRLALLLAHTHLWKVSERARLSPVPPEITDHLILAERYFAEARQLAPDDDRILGWLGSVKLALGTIHRDERVTREGYFMVKGTAAAYPQFADFTLSYTLVGQPHDSSRFTEAVAAMWENLDLCFGHRYDRVRPVLEWAPVAALRTDSGLASVCWNTALVPHNVEGFFLHFGDVLLKNGQKEAAETTYRFIKTVPEYATWRYKPTLEERLANLDDWMARLRGADRANDPPYMLNSVIACLGCHAR